MTARAWSRRLWHRRRRDDQGAILIIAIIVVTVVALVVGFVLTRGDGSLRAAVQLREVAGSTYAADGAAQIALNNLRTGDGEGWKFTSDAGESCFENVDAGAGDPETVDSLTLGPGFSDGDYKAYVECLPEPGMGDEGTETTVTVTNRPEFAIISDFTWLRSLYNPGFGDPCGNRPGGSPNANDIPIRLRGGIRANTRICTEGPSTIEDGNVLSASCPTRNNPRDKVTFLTTDGATTPYNYNCSAAPRTYSWPSELQAAADPAAPTIPVRRTVPWASCAAAPNVMAFEPGFYADVVALERLTNNCNKVLWFKPGTYYFDFLNDSDDPLHDATLPASSDTEWRITTGKIVGGGNTQPAAFASQSLPGACQGPTTDATNQGVQFIFGAKSALAIATVGTATGGTKPEIELCGTYRTGRPPIVLYGQQQDFGPMTQSQQQTTTETDEVFLTGTSGVNRSPVPNGIGTVTTDNWRQISSAPSSWNGTSNPTPSTLTVGAINTASTGTSGPVAAWRRTTSTTGSYTSGCFLTSSNSRCASIPLTGFNTQPGAAIPVGAEVTGVRLRARHREWRHTSSNGDSIGSTPRTRIENFTMGGVNLGSVSFNIGDDDDEPEWHEVAVSESGSAWTSFVNAIEANGYSGGASGTYTVALGRNQAAYLDAVQLEIDYEITTTTTTTVQVPIPYLRRQTLGDNSGCGSTITSSCSMVRVFRIASGTGSSPTDHDFGGEVYFRGTVFAPNAGAMIGIPNANDGAPLFGWGLVLKSLFFERNYSGDVGQGGGDDGVSDPDDAEVVLPPVSTGLGDRGKNVQLQVYLCPASVAECTPTAPGARLALKSRVQLWDPYDEDDVPDVTRRSVSVLSWSHQR